MRGLSKAQLVRWVVAALLIVGIGVGVGGLASIAHSSSEEPAIDEPSVAEVIEGTDLSKVTVTADGVRRLGLKTATVVDAAAGPKAMTSVPYAAVFYDRSGASWVYTSPETNVFVRAPITIDHVTSDTAFLTVGPPAGTAVVTVGAPELYGTEVGVSE